MATVLEVKQAIADEKAQITAAVDAFNQQIQDLKDQIADGQAVTPADLDEVVDLVHGIFTPAG